MSHLLDVSILVACAWHSHPQHGRANRWLDDLPGFATCSATQMGFLRVSMSPAFGARYPEASASLKAIVGLRKHRFVADDTPADRLPLDLTSRHDVTDAHYVTLAARNDLKLATLDTVLCTKPWAAGIALNPLARV